MKFRQHRGSLDVAMRTVVELPPTKAALAAHLNSLGDIWGRTITPDDLVVRWYMDDARIGWRTHIVTLRGSAIGFTDGPTEEP